MADELHATGTEMSRVYAIPGKCPLTSLAARATDPGAVRWHQLKWTSATMTKAATITQMTTQARKCSPSGSIFDFSL